MPSRVGRHFSCAVPLADDFFQSRTAAMPREVCNKRGDAQRSDLKQRAFPGFGVEWRRRSFAAMRSMSASF